MSTTSDRREKIVTRSAELFATKGVVRTTVREIGNEAGILSASLYYYFKSKHDIVNEILNRFMEENHRRLSSVVEHSETPEDTVCGLIRETLLIIDEYPCATTIYQNDQQYLREHGLLTTIDISSQAVRDYWMDAISAGIAAATFRDDLPPEIFYRTVRDSLWNSMHWPGRASYSTSEFAELLISLFFRGFASHKPGERI